MNYMTEIKYERGRLNHTVMCRTERSEGEVNKVLNLSESRNITIQGLRGVSCIIVFLSHAFGMIPVKKGLFFEIPFLHLFYDGKIAVCMFWVLSGYYITKKMMKFSVKTYVSFLLKKFFRLYPLYMMSLIAGTLFCNMRLTFDELYFSSWFSGFWNKFVVVSDLQKQLILRGDFNIINPPSWTMKNEFEMVILLPFILAVVSLILKKVKWVNLCLLIISFLIVCGGGGKSDLSILQHSLCFVWGH